MGVEGGETSVREIKKYKFPVAKYRGHGYEMYNVGNRVDNRVISLYGERLISLYGDILQLDFSQ